MSKCFFVAFYDSTSDSFDSVFNTAINALRNILGFNGNYEEVIKKANVSPNEDAKRLILLLKALSNNKALLIDFGQNIDLYTMDGLDLTKDDLEDMASIINSQLTDNSLVCHVFNLDPADLNPINNNIVVVKNDIFTARMEQKIREKINEWKAIINIKNNLSILLDKENNESGSLIYPKDTNPVTHIIDELNDNKVFSDPVYSQCSRFFIDLNAAWNVFVNSIRKGKTNSNALEDAATISVQLCKHAMACLEQNGIWLC